MTETSGTPSAQMQKPQVQRRWCWLTAWRGLTGVVLLLSPFLGFVISSFAIFLVTVMTRSGRRHWLGKLVLGCALLIPARLSGAYLSSWWGYRSGYQQAIEATDRGEEYFLAAQELRGRWCLVDDPCSPFYAHWCGRRAGIRDGLPAHAVNPDDAVGELLKRGAVLSTRLFREVCTYSRECECDRMDEYIERGVLFESDFKAVVLDGELMTDADMKLMQAFTWFAPLDYVEINAPRITQTGIKSLSLDGHERNWNRRLRMKVLRISRSQLDRDALYRLRDQRAQQFEDVTTLFPLHNHDHGLDEALAGLRTARQRRAEWNARQQDGDSRTDALK